MNSDCCGSMWHRLRWALNGQCRFQYSDAQFCCCLICELLKILGPLFGLELVTSSTVSIILFRWYTGGPTCIADFVRDLSGKGFNLRDQEWSAALLGSSIGYCPTLRNSWIIIIIWLYIALNRTPNIDCYCVGAVPKSST